MRGSYRIARSDRRDVFVAFAVLFGILVSHSILETARDALFLAALPASRLPWVYIGIAVAALVVVWLNDRALARFHKRRLLQATLVIAALVTAGFWLLADRGGNNALYAFYIWTGLVATVSVAQFWILLAERFTVTSAKRAYAVIAAGGLVGATIGSAAAGALLELMSPAQLLLVSPGVLLATAVGTGWLARDVTLAPGRRRGRPAGMRSSLVELVEHPYLRRLLLLVVATTIVVTGVDLLFKTVVAREVAAEDLGSFFAIFYAALNGLALIAQLFLASRVISALGVNRTLLILPLLLLAGAVGFVLSGAVLVILLLKGFDGTLRHSINRTGSEVLYLPVPAGLRARSKVFIDGVGARGGQALAALAILGALAVGATPLHLAIAIGVVAGMWLLLVVGLQRHYLELFRQQLRAGSIETRLDVPDLDLHSLEALLAALNSEDEGLVVNAMELLEHSGRARLIPALILYHPSREVVTSALSIFVDAERTDFVPVARRLLHAVDPEIRAAALRALIAVAPDEETLRAATADNNPAVRSTAIVGLASAGLCRAGELARVAGEIADGDSPETRLALVQAIPAATTPELAAAVERLAAVPEPALQSAIADTVAAAPDERFLPLLLPMLAVRESRPAARRAFLTMGDDALEFLERALADTDLDPRVSLHLPRTISRFGGPRVVACLLRHMREDPDSRASYKSLRGLGRLVADDPDLDLDTDAVREVAQVTVERALTLLAWRMNIERGGRAEPQRATIGAQILTDLLREKEHSSIERVFRLFGLLHPEEDFERIYAGLYDGDDKLRSSSRELLENIIEEPVRSAVLALSDDNTDSIRLLEANGFFKPLLYSYEEQLAAMLNDRNEAIRLLSAHHVNELGLGDLSEELAALEGEEPGILDSVVNRALDILGLSPEPTTHAT